MTSSKRLETLTKNRSSLDHKTTHLYFISLAPDSYVQSQPPDEQRRSSGSEMEFQTRTVNRCSSELLWGDVSERIESRREKKRTPKGPKLSCALKRTYPTKHRQEKPFDLKDEREERDQEER